MSYADGQHELSGSVDPTGSTAVEFNPGYQPMTVRAAAFVVTTSLDADTDIALEHWPTAGSNTGATNVDTITVPSSAAAGDVIYVDGFEQLVSPGEGVALVPDGSAGSGAGVGVLFYQTTWEQPDNNDNMTESA